MQETIVAGAPLPDSAASAIWEALEHLVEHGERVQTASGKTWIESLAYQTGMLDAKRRIIMNPVRSLDLVAAIGRFVWMMRGDEATSTVAYYVPRAANFSVDGITLPGSNYGHRLRRSLPGVDQLHGVIDRLRAFPESRQACAVIWNPMDAVRVPFDIPCALGTLYHHRAGALSSTTMMRSNKPLTLMPFNFFEFSLLAEIIGAEVGVPVGQYLHWVGAMQLPEQDRKAAETFLGAKSTYLAMDPMPRTPQPLAQINILARLEEELRTACDEAQLSTILGRAEEELHPYWLAFARVLSLRWFALRNRTDELQSTIANLPDYFAIPLETTLLR